MLRFLAYLFAIAAVVAVAFFVFIVVSFLPGSPAHNSPDTANILAGTFGRNLPFVETWYSQDKVFTGFGSQYVRLRFAPSSREAAGALLHAKCTPGGEAIPRDWLPKSQSMPWDLNPHPAEVHTCGRFNAEFAASADAILLFHRGH